MKSSSLPVIILKRLVLFPHSEIRVDIERNFNLNAIDFSEQHTNYHVLVINQKDPLEENPTTKELFKVGIIAEIRVKSVLNNGKIKIVYKD
jgi:ATP-dependent Lon protease